VRVSAAECGRAQESTAECKRVWKSMSEHGEVQVHGKYLETAKYAISGVSQTLVISSPPH
jgi:hypothetical protein